ncbi:uncharacterized protein Triagg1_1809 [Trichoderma aggressivum f. europaeum]|uniref:Oxidoreductase n=1 Tax=Trichoderma aggressivum f. europaeum TaxID=173218 RepID=A0AAE1M642_9HYPO|nr:hypothetical protein Triagg1_1809 [Trichoderma aggressivum f. europaeum]
MSRESLSVVVIGIGPMGTSHLLAYHHNPTYKVIGIVSRSTLQLPTELKEYESLALLNLKTALLLKPDVVSINTHSDSHVEYAVASMEAGAHVFVEKPLATSVADAKRVVETAKRTGKKIVIGYILRHHPSWVEFIRQARQFGPPFVMRMNLNQRSEDSAGDIHKRFMETTSPVVDCGVHYIDVMLQITDSRAVQVRGMGVRLSDEIDKDQVNYGHLQITFEDGSVGWYDASWGPMISTNAFFIKDVMGPRGAVLIVMDSDADSSDVNAHTKTANIKVAPVNEKATIISMKGEPVHDELCALEQEYLLESILEDRDLYRHMNDAVQSLAVVLAADKSMRENRAIDL